MDPALTKLNVWGSLAGAERAITLVLTTLPPSLSAGDFTEQETHSLSLSLFLALSITVCGH